MKPLAVVSFGLGPIGLAAARHALTRRSLRLVGAIDVDPQKVGKDLSELLGLPERTGVKVEADAAAAFARLQPDAILHCTSSFLPQVKDQLLAAARAGIDVVSSTEELLLPELQQPQIAQELHQAALAGGSTIVGTGVNPGFAMDFVAILASAVCYDVQSVRCVRVVDAGTRRLPLQKKVGAGLTVAEFREQEKTGRFGHIGMRESVALIGKGLDLQLDAIDQTLEPVLATEQRGTPFLTVNKGHVAGIRNIGHGRRGGKLLVELDLSMYVGAQNPRDEAYLTGSPNVTLRFEGGIPGDQATAAILVNTLAQVAASTPGLKTILDVAPPRLLR
jgi:4-hydroxy-tetrahydrodipicolinate reductase